MLTRVSAYKNIILLIAAILIISIAASLILLNDSSSVDDGWLNDLNENNFNEMPQSNNQKDDDIPVVIMVDIKGEVKKPGVYAGEEGERVIDLINRAGGLTEAAFSEAVNFAMFVEDEMVIHVPNKSNDDNLSEPSPMVVSAKNNGLVNINKASVDELVTLSGIGPSKAAAIVDYREQNGKFNNVDDLKLVSGIGEKTFEKIVNQISVK